MVSVLAVRPFDHLGRYVERGEWVELDAIDAAVKAHAGLVSLSHGHTYQTRDMVAAAPIQHVTVDPMIATTHSIAPDPDAPPKRRRGRPRKNQV